MREQISPALSWQAFQEMTHLGSARSLFKQVADFVQGRCGDRRMTGIHDDGLAQISPIEEDSPRQRPPALHACRDQHFCDVRDPAGVDGGNGRGNVLIFCSPGPDGSLQTALRDKGSPHEMFETVWFSFRDFEIANNLFRRALLPALQDPRSEIGYVAEVPVKTPT